ncbi:DinB family protein [Fluviicola sp.]|uniref:DinB family protein n=1 Tax=Fluviicola sp. TaxID=1917219 RepID=UPI002618191F|nr:DinB family protein [Fluviicola sp.]
MTTNLTTVKMIMDRWEASVKSCDTLLQSLSDEQLEREIAPGKNRGTYLLGHLIAVHDDMLILLDMGKKAYPELKRPFIELPDKATTELPSVKELRQLWEEQNTDLKQRFDAVKPEDWFQRHTAVSESDFANEPHRNKLNIILTRTTHLAYHTGQLVLLK